MRPFKFFQRQKIDAVDTVVDFLQELSAIPQYQIPIQRYDDRISLDVIDFVKNYHIRNRISFDNNIARFVITERTFDDNVLTRCKVCVYPYTQDNLIRLEYTLHITSENGRLYPQIISKTMYGL